MKKVFKSLLLMAAIGSLTFTSCSKDENKTATESAPPTVTINNGATGDNKSAVTQAITLRIEVSADTDRKIKRLSITRTLIKSTGSTSANVIYNRSYDAKDVIYTHIDSLSVNGVTIDDGDRINYKVEATDDKDKVTSKEYIINITSIATSGQILLGAPGNTINEYRFFGIAENFRRYRAGATGADLARNNVSNIDFIYFWNSAGSVQNALYSPDFNFAPGTGWATEVSSWTGTKNKTLLKETSMDISTFNALSGNNFFAEMNQIDFSTGTQDRIANLQQQTVLAFRLANGKRGFLAIISTSASNTGVITLVVKVEL
jgi:hypothetical protein